MKRKKIAALLLSLFMAFSMLMHPSAASEKATQSQSSEMTEYLPLDLSREDSQPVFVKQSGNTLKLRFRANPATGYEWVLRIGEEETLSLYQKIYIQAPNPEGKDGVGGNTTFTLKGHKAGTTLVYLHYRQNWKGGEIASFCTLRVNLGKGGEILSAKVIRSGLKSGNGKKK